MIRQESTYYPDYQQKTHTEYYDGKVLFFEEYDIEGNVICGIKYDKNNREVKEVRTYFENGITKFLYRYIDV